MGRAGTGIDLSGAAAISFGPAPKDIAEKIGATTLSVSQLNDDYPVAFARMLAKIAYCMGIAQDIVQPQDCADLIRSILGDDDNIGNWVGSSVGPIRKYPGLLHRLATMRNDVVGALAVQVQLFAHSETPSYDVILRAGSAQ